MTTSTERCGPPRPAAPGPAPSIASASLLRLLWLASPALPVGGFSYSEALESAVESGCVGNEAQARGWLVDQLHLGLARSELPLFASAFAAWQRGDLAAVRELNDWFTQTRETSELGQQTQQMGRSLLAWLRNDGPGVGDDAALAALAALAPAPTWPLAFALAAGRSGAPLHEALLAFAFSWAENAVQAALKAVPLGQGAGQRILAALADAIPAAVAHAVQLGDGERQVFTPMLAVLSAQHEVQYSRLFRS